MKYLLDTHYLLWSVLDSRRISVRLKDVLTDSQNQIIVSAISFWEISLKSSLGKLQLQHVNPQDLPAICLEMSFLIEPLEADICGSYHQLNATWHKDPFDRMLIWTAISKNYTLVTADANIKKYKNEGLKVYKG